MDIEIVVRAGLIGRRGCRLLGYGDGVSIRHAELTSSLECQLISKCYVFVASCARSIVYVSPSPDLNDACCSVVW